MKSYLVDSLQLNILILSLGGVQGIFLFFLLYKKKKALPGYLFLAAYFVIMILQIVMKLAGKFWLMDTMRPLYGLSYYLPFLYGPLIWLFIKSSTTKGSMNKNDWIHFLPFILSMLCFFPGSSAVLPAFVLTVFETRWIMSLQLISLLLYHLKAYYLIDKSEKPSFPTWALSYKNRLNWMKQFVLLSLVVCSVLSIVICFMYYSFPRMQFLRFGFSGLTIFIYWVSCKAWMEPELFTVVHGHGIQSNKIIPDYSMHPVKKYSNSGLSREGLQRIICSLKDKLSKDKCYLDPELSIDGLSASLGCSRYHLSQAMNDELGLSFYDCINQYRIEEAKNLLNDPDRSSYKISSLAYDAGFNSISTFNEVFKKSTGLTPSQFRKQQEEDLLRKQRL